MKKTTLKSGSLWVETLQRTEQALRVGALLPITTESTFINDGGINFMVRIVTNLARKTMQKQTEGDESVAIGKKKPNPFLPFETDMFVSDISDTHICLLNKFNVIDHHLLIVTREFEDQEMLLTQRDFEAIRSCIAEFDALAFYNGGKVAGASQPHKHLQMIPLPMAKNGPRAPIEPLFDAARSVKELGVVPGLPFVHSYARIASDSSKDVSWTSNEGYRLYRQMLQSVGLNSQHGPEKSRQSGPYNFLFTREWMLLVPRATEFFGPISVNALGFAGALLVQDEQQMRMLQDHGCMAVLKHTAVAV